VYLQAEIAAIAAVKGVTSQQFTAEYTTLSLAGEWGFAGVSIMCLGI
jgi:hypothetical protein